MVLTQYNRHQLIEKLELDIKFILDQTTVTGFTTVQHRKWIELELKEKSFNQTINLTVHPLDKMASATASRRPPSINTNNSKEA